MCNTYYLCAVLFIFSMYIALSSSYENMEDLPNDYNIFQIKEEANSYKIYNKLEQGRTNSVNDYGIPKLHPVGLTNKSSLGENVSKLLLLTKYAKKKYKGNKNEFKAYVRYDNGRWLGISQNEDLVTVNEEDKVLWTFVPVDGKNYHIYAENGKWISYNGDIHGKLIVSQSAPKFVAILDQIY